MRIRVLLFGPAARAVGAASVEADLDRSSTTAALRERLSVQCAALRPYLSAGRFAVNQKYAEDGAEIREADEVALISMVSGG